MLNRKAILRFLGLGLSVVFLAFFSTGCKRSAQTNNPNKVFAYATVEEGIGQRLLQKFREESGIEVEFVRLSTGEATARLEAERNNPQASIWMGGGALGHAEAKAKGLTIPYQSELTKKIPAEYRDPDGFWNAIYIGVLVFAVNPEQLKKNKLPAPKTWADLKNPIYKGHIQLPNPGTSGTSYNLMTTLIKSLGGEAPAFDYLKALNANVSQYTRSGAAPAKNAALGETAIAIGYAHDILTLIHGSKAPLEIIYPTDGTGYEIAAASLIKGGQNLPAARKLIDWLLGKSAAEILAASYYVPLLKDGVTLKAETAWPKELKLIDTDIDWAGKNKKRLIELWNEKING